MTRLHLARHGETVWHAEHRYAGSSDVALTEVGAQQAEQLGRWAGARSLGGIYSSDLTRAIRTAAPAAQATGYETIVDPRLREVHFGVAEGMTAAQLRERWPAEWSAFELHPATAPFPDGEAGTAAIDRAWPALLEIADRGVEDVLVGMHATLIRLLLCRVLGIDPDRYRSLFPMVANTGITTLDLGADTIGLLGFNLPPG